MQLKNIDQNGNHLYLIEHWNFSKFSHFSLGVSLYLVWIAHKKHIKRTIHSLLFSSSCFLHGPVNLRGWLRFVFPSTPHFKSQPHTKAFDTCQLWFVINPQSIEKWKMTPSVHVKWGLIWAFCYCICFIGFLQEVCFWFSWNRVVLQHEYFCQTPVELSIWFGQSYLTRNWII